MMKAILDGRKTVTRRALRYNPDCIVNGLPCCSDSNQIIQPEFWGRSLGEVGNIKEIWGVRLGYPENTPPAELTREMVRYKVDGHKDVHRWTSPMFMPGQIARARYRIVSLSVGMLLDIDNEEARREGFDNAVDCVGTYWDMYRTWGQNMVLLRIEFRTSYFNGTTWTEFPDVEIRK